MTHVIVLMGVSGSGKTTVGKALALALGCPFYDGDDFHPPKNVAKMAHGIPLNDDDRYPWLARLHDMISRHLKRGEAAVFACSALKKRYRDHLRGGNKEVLFVYLQGDFETIWERMQAREGHYMKAEMLQSQFETLEAPGPNEAITINISGTVEQITDNVLAAIRRANDIDVF